jgi:Zn finger protein HypA/HybF involved in hydrogenase expression
MTEQTFECRTCRIETTSEEMNEVKMPGGHFSLECPDCGGDTFIRLQPREPRPASQH